MKVIDLLNKIANGEEVPKKIKCKENIYEKGDSFDSIEQLYQNYEYDNWLECEDICLNDEIEVIEEPKKIEKLEHIYKIEQDMNLDSVIDWQNVNNKIFKKKIDKIIDYINGDNNENS